MKKSVLILGIALVSFSSICNAKSTVNMPLNLFQESILSNDTTGIQNKLVKFEKPSVSNDEEVFNPENVITYNSKRIKDIIAEGDKITEYNTSDDVEFMAYEESMKEIIAQSELIIDSSVPNTVLPLLVERTINDEIAELELIIESKETNEVYPLDFKKINRNLLMNNSFRNEKFVGMN